MFDTDVLYSALNFIENNLLYVLIALFFFFLILLKPFRNFIVYCIKNIASLVFFVCLSMGLSALGHTISINAVSVLSALLLGLPGISFALFLSLVI